MDRGYLKLWRRSLDSEIFHNPEMWRLWTWCLMKTSYKQRFLPFYTGKGKISVKVEAGQFIFGRNKAAEFLGDSPSTIWKRMKKLEYLKNIIIQSNKQYSVITICNWEEYQEDDRPEVTGKGQASDRQVTTEEQLSDNRVTTEEQLSDTNKKVKKVNKDKKKKDICSDEQKTFASHLVQIVSSRREINITPSQLASWANTFRLMMDRDKISSVQITNVLGWYEKNWMNDFVPVVSSAGSFREKWTKLLDAIDRAKKATIGDTNNGFDQRDYRKDATREEDLPKFLR